jgi:hypothetical protein
MQRLEGYLRRKVVVQPDGTLKDRTIPAVRDALYAALFSDKPREYARVRCPALAIYASHYYPPNADKQKRNEIETYERQYWFPYQVKSMERLRRELANVEVVRVPGAHSSFYFTNRERVLEPMLRFLGAPSHVSAKAVP